MAAAVEEKRMRSAAIVPTRKGERQPRIEQEPRRLSMAFLQSGLWECLYLRRIATRKVAGRYLSGAKSGAAASRPSTNP